MRKWFVIILIIIFIRADGVNAANERDELNDIATVAEQNHLDIESWEVTIREKMSKTDLKKHVKKFKKTNDVTEENTGDLTTYIVHNAHKNVKISVLYKAVLPTNSEQGELIAIISAEEWSENTLFHYKDVLKSLFDTYFSKSAHKFTCLLANNGGILNRTTLRNKLSKSFNIKYQETQIDNFQQNMQIEEVYGYTNLWNKKLMILDKPMNIHIAFIHKANGEEKIIIGTPILINEY